MAAAISRSAENWCHKCLLRRNKQGERLFSLYRHFTIICNSHWRGVKPSGGFITTNWQSHILPLLISFQAFVSRLPRKCVCACVWQCFVATRAHDPSDKLVSVSFENCTRRLSYGGCVTHANATSRWRLGDVDEYLLIVKNVSKSFECSFESM